MICAILFFIWWLAGTTCLLIWKRKRTSGYLDGEDMAFAVFLGLGGLIVVIPVLIVLGLEWWDNEKERMRHGNG